MGSVFPLCEVATINARLPAVEFARSTTKQAIVQTKLCSAQIKGGGKEGCQVHYSSTDPNSDRNASRETPLTVGPIILSS